MSSHGTSEIAHFGSEKKFHNIFEYSNDAIFVIDPERDKILQANSKASQMLEYTCEELSSLSITTLDPEEIPKLRTFASAVFEKGIGWTDELTWRTKSGRILLVEISASVIEVDGKRCMLAVVRDTTKRKLAPRSNWSEMSQSEHFVQFYETDVFLLDSLSGFIGTGLGAGDACIVLATKAHRESLEERLKANGLGLAAAQTRGEYISLDAVETLSKFMVDGLPEPERFAEVVGSIIARATKGRRRVRIFGEMVALLWADGNRAAISLEELWNDLVKTHSFSLFCAYPMYSFAGEVYGVQFTEICKQHSRVIPDESYTALASPDERLRAITLLQQKANSLEAEIAERKVAEERLRVSENRYRRLFEASKDGILIVDPRTRKITDANPFITELLGYTHEQLLGQELWQIGLFQDREANLEVLRDLQEKHFIRYETLPLQTKDGQRRYVEFVSNLYQANGHKVIQCNMRDITARLRAEEALRESEARLRFMAESMPQKIFTAKPNGGIDYFNPQWTEFTGLSFEQIRDWGWTQFIHPDDVGENVHRWQHSLATGEPFYFEHRFRRADGVYRWHISRAIPMRDAEGNITMWIGSNTDIDEQKQLEARKDEFISMASHELKTPVTSLKGFTHLLQRRWSSEGDAQTRLFLERMEVQLTKLTKLISDLLDLSKIQTGKLTYQEELVDLDVLVHDTVEQVQATTSTHHLQCVGQTYAQVSGDRDRLGQVFINLLSNAVKYSPGADTVLITLAKDGEHALVSIRDFGIGIAEAHHERIFERFYQVPDPLEKTFPGLGIGLYLSREMILRHQGRLWVESRKGQGSTFHVSLPVQQWEQEGWREGAEGKRA